MVTFLPQTTRQSESDRGPSLASPEASQDQIYTVICDAKGNPLVAEGDTARPLILTGVSKLYTLAMVLREFERGTLSPDTRASELLPRNTLSGLCRVGGQDYSDEVTISQLLAHRSGIPDYFAFPKRGALSLLRQIGERDRGWTFEQALELARHYPGRFRPGTPGRVHYSDTNYQILGAILRTTTGLSFSQLLDIRVVGPLGLRHTYAFTADQSEKYSKLAPVRWGHVEVHAPQSLASCGADGSIVASAADVVEFLQAFWSGKLCDESWMPRLWSDTHRLSPSTRMGLGVMTLSRGRRESPLVGHSGFSGSAALVDPTRRLFGVMTTNTIQWVHKPLSRLARAMDRVSF